MALILVLSSLFAASRECHGFGVSIRPRIAPLLSRRHSSLLEDDYTNEHNDFAAGDLEVLRAEIEEMGGDSSFLLPDPRDSLIRKPPKEEFPTNKNDVVMEGIALQARSTSYIGSLSSVHPLISKALEEENVNKEGYNEQIDSVEDMEALRAEIEAMGGDPSFLPNPQREPLTNRSIQQEQRRKVGKDDDKDAQNDSVEDMEALRSEIEAMGGDPSFLPNPQREPLIRSKQKIGGLKFGEDGDDNEQNDSATDLEALRAEVEEMGGGSSLLSSPPTQPLINGNQEERLKVRGANDYNEQGASAADLETTRADIEAMGGDPWFLSGPQRETLTKKKHAERGKLTEADEFDDEDSAADIEAIGGDPWFLPSRRREPLMKNKQDELLKVGGGDDGDNQQDDSAADIEAMGGDPWFLPSPQREPLMKSKQNELLKVGGYDSYNDQDDSAADIEAIGGNPWFLPSPQSEPLVNRDDNHDEENEADLEALRAKIEAMGGDSSLPCLQKEPLMNSREQEERLKVGGDDKYNEKHDSAADLEVQQAEIEAMGGDPWFLPTQQRDPMINTLLKEQEEELLQIGGDPAFLGNDNQQNDPCRDLELLRAEIEELGGDPSFL
jgi:hypothetical protein